jgi:ubiquinol-cytochrome c reductase cytochrome c1 subunit
MLMRQLFIFIFILIFTLGSTLTVASEEGSGEHPQLAKAPINRADMSSVKRGAKFFATNCMSCHTLIYLRYDPIAQEAGITYDKMPINVKSWPYGVTPPDLSLEADIRGPNWIYTYLHSFYKDPSRPTGVNNLLVPDTAMANMVGPYQGEQVRVSGKPSETLFGTWQWYDLVKLTQQGSMTPEQFDETMADVVNFLAYAAEPFHNEQRRLGWWVLGFLVILFVFMYLLKKEYWKDVKRNKKDEVNKKDSAKR